MTKCECGCGRETTINQNSGLLNKFIHGHNNRNIPMSEEQKQKISKTLTSIPLSKETKQKQSKAKLGKKNPMFGIPQSEEHKRKNREGHLGIQKSEETKKKIGKGNKGKKRSEEQKQNQREKMSGDKNPMYIDGRNHNPYHPNFNASFKKRVRERDNYTCQNCGIKENGCRHAVHHIHYDKENCYPDVITLCGPCNSKANSNKDVWEAYYMNKLNDKGLLQWTTSKKEHRELL